MLAGIATVIATLSSTVAWLFKLRENENAKRLSELTSEVATIGVKADKCEEERGELKIQCAIMHGKVSVLETRLSYIDVNGTKFSHKQEEGK
jgi:hypothetical protein